MIIERVSIREVLARIARDEALPPGAETRARAALIQLASQQTPWYLRIIIAIGAWVGASFLLWFVLAAAALALGGDFNHVAVVFGIVFTVAATVLRRQVSGPFFRQVALVGSFTGQMLFIGGVGGSSQSIIPASAAAAFVSTALIVAFPDRVQRFSSTLVIVGSLIAVIAQWKIVMGMDALALMLMAAMLVLWRAAPRADVEEAADIVEPVVYGLAVSLFGVLLLNAFFGIVDVRDFAGLRPGLPTILGFVLALLWLIVSIFAEHRVPVHRPIVLAALATAVLLGALTRTTPAIVGTLVVLVLGFDRRARGLIALATVFLLVFASLYYYTLQLTLLQKSGVLIASGIVCLAAWAFVRTQVAAETIDAAGAVETVSTGETL